MEPELGNVVSVRALAKHYRGKGASGKLVDVAAVDGVDLDVRAGQLVVLLGPSGCGKTTLLRCIAGLEKPSAGSIAINGRPVFSQSRNVFVPPEDRRIGMMFQSYALWPHMTVAQNVAYPLTSSSGGGTAAVPSRDVPAKVDGMLQRLGVAGLGHRFPGELSGGQQQRVALARALIASPSLILFDEPLSNVDAKVRRHLRAELRELKSRTNFAGIYVTHDQEEAMELADVLVVMENGKIVQSGPPREVYSYPTSSYVAGFVGEINRWPATVDRVDGGSVHVTTELGGFTLNRSRMGSHMSAQAGDRGWFGIRPEHVHIDAPGSARPESDGQRLTGTIKDVVYLGARIECRVEVAGAELSAWIHDDSDTGLPIAKGQRVAVSFASEHTRWLAA
ncbi:ABC transporter ATP-binding protein [soil metagenome]